MWSRPWPIIRQRLITSKEKVRNGREKQEIWFLKKKNLLGQASAASKVKLKVADHCALTEKYARAIEIYEETGIAYLANNLLKYSAKNLFFQAGICHLCSEDLVAAKRAVERYQDLDVTFSTQRECKFLLKLIECCEAYNSDGLTLAVRDFNQITPLDNWKTTLLLRVKNSIGNAGQNEDLT